MYNTRHDHLEQLKYSMVNAMMRCYEIPPITDFVKDDVIQSEERRLGSEFTAAEILQAWLDAADYAVDSWVANACETPDWDDAERTARIASYESMRPSTIRRNELLKRFAGC